MLLPPFAALMRQPVIRTPLTVPGPVAGFVPWNLGIDLFGHANTLGGTADLVRYATQAGYAQRFTDDYTGSATYGDAFAVTADKSVLVVAALTALPASLNACLACVSSMNPLGGSGASTWAGVLGVNSSGAVTISDYDGASRTSTAGVIELNRWFCAAGSVRSNDRLMAAKDGVLGTSTSIGTAQSASAWRLSTGMQDDYGSQTVRLSGYIALILFWNRALSDAELIAYSADPWQFFRRRGPRLVKMPAVSAAVTIGCSVGNATAAGTAAVINSAQTVSCSVGNAAAAGTTATISNAASVVCSVGNAVAAGTAAVVNSAVSVACSVGNAAAAGVTATISTSGAVTIDCGVGAAVAAGTTAGIESPISVSCSVGAAVATGIGCAVSSNVYINCAVGDAIAVGVTATITTSGADSVDCSVGNAVAAGVSSSISGGLTLSTADIEAIADAVWAHPKALTLGKYLGLR